MIRRNTLILLILFVILLGVAIYLQKRPISSSTPIATSTPAPSLLNTTSTAITAIKMEDKEGQVAATIGQNAQWAVQQPANGQITAGNMQEILSQVTSISVLATLETPPPAEATGLNQPDYTLTFSLTTGQDLTLKIGKLTPTSSGYYVQVNQGNPQVVDKYGLDRVIELLKTARATPTPPPTVTPIQAAPSQTPTPTQAP
jgi:Domain of unknown function (DUF4340)